MQNWHGPSIWIRGLHVLLETLHEQGGFFNEEFLFFLFFYFYKKILVIILQKEIGKTAGLPA